MAISPIPIEPFSESIRSIGNSLLLLAANFADCKVPLTTAGKCMEIAFL